MIITIDMDKAREIQRGAIRAMREPLFADLDRAFTRAQGRVSALDGPRKTEAEATMRAIEAQRQALRDAPADPRIDAAQTPEELKAAIPDVLKG
jgi:hypothetical protein